MPSTLDKPSQLTPSQFAHLNTVEPSNNASGITPGQALLDRLSPDHSAPVVKQSQRLRKPSTRKVEASQSLPSALKLNGKETAKPTVSKPSGKSLGNVTSKSAANPGLQTGGTGLAGGSSADANQEDHHHDGDDDDDYVGQAIIDYLKALVGHSTSHLSGGQLKSLLDAAIATQMSPMCHRCRRSPDLDNVQMQACINEWRTRSYKADELDADNQQVDYERHLLSLYEYERFAGGQLATFRAEWSAAGLQYSETPHDVVPNNTLPYVLMSDIQPDTPPPEYDD